MKTVHLVLGLIISSASVLPGATGIYGGYLTVSDGLASTKYKSSASYGGSEPTFTGSDLGDIDISGTLNLTQMETLTFQNSGHSTFEFAFAYRVRAAAAAISTNPADYSFVIANVGDSNGVDIGGGNEKGEWAGSVNLLSGLAEGDYALDIVHKAGAFEGGSNFERLASQSNTDPGDTSWSSTNAFSASFSVVPEPSVALLGALGVLGLLQRRRA